MHAYRAKIQSRFSRKQSLKRKIFILYFRLLFSRRITPFLLVSPITNHPVYLWIQVNDEFNSFNDFIITIMLCNFGVTTAYDGYAGIPLHSSLLQLPFLSEKIGQCAISSFRTFFGGIVALSPLSFFLFYLFIHWSWTRTSSFPTDSFFVLDINRSRNRVESHNKKAL